MEKTIFNTTGGTTTLSLWSDAERVEVIEFVDKVEFIYKETSLMQLGVYPPRPQQQRVFKIVFSCVDGKWNKSERIYGNIIPPSSESYSF